MKSTLPLRMPSTLASFGTPINWFIISQTALLEVLHARPYANAMQPFAVLI
jgi:hypothetical protein